jgi:tetratricopeptide (TPR) repeat protein
MLTETLALLEPLSPGPEHVAVLTELSGEHSQIGDYESGLEVADRALALAAELGLGRPARALGYRATNSGYLGHADASDDFRDALELALAAGQVRHASTIYNNWSIFRRRDEGPAQALETLNAGIAVCRARGLTSRVNWMVQNSLGSLLAQGDHEQTLTVASAVEERARLEGDMQAATRALYFQANVWLLRGHPERVAEVADEVEPWLVETTDRQSKWMGITTVARIRAALGQPEAAIALLTRLMDEDLTPPHDAQLTALELGEVELAERMNRRWDSPRVLARIAEARDDLEAALAIYKEAADRHRRRGEPVFLIEALVGSGRVHARLGRTTEAAQALNEARPILVELQAAPMLAETDALLGRLTAASA